MGFFPDQTTRCYKQFVAWCLSAETTSKHDLRAMQYEGWKAAYDLHAELREAVARIRDEKYYETCDLQEDVDAAIESLAKFQTRFSLSGMNSP